MDIYCKFVVGMIPKWNKNSIIPKIFSFNLLISMCRPIHNTISLHLYNNLFCVKVG